jgi:hypothetical protein
MTGMLTHSEKFIREVGNTGATKTESAFDQQGSLRMEEQSSAGSEIIAHVKVLDPLLSTGPSTRARVVNDSASMVIINFPRIVFVGALIQIRMQSKILFGKARRCTAKGSEYEVEIEKQEIY